MKARSRVASGDWATVRGILQVTHITWPSTAGSVVRISPVAAASGGRRRGRGAP